MCHCHCAFTGNTTESICTGYLFHIEYFDLSDHSADHNEHQGAAGIFDISIAAVDYNTISTRTECIQYPTDS